MGAASDRGGVQSGESFRVRGKTCFLGEPRGMTVTLASPLRAAKQGLGSELTSGGGQEPSLPEPQRDSCQRQLTDEV